MATVAGPTLTDVVRERKQATGLDGEALVSDVLAHEQGWDRDEVEFAVRMVEEWTR